MKRSEREGAGREGGSSHPEGRASRGAALEAPRDGLPARERRAHTCDL